MPGSTTTPSQERTRNIARPHVAFRLNHGVGTRELKTFAAQWPACTLLCRRFADALTGATARLEVDMIRYIFIVEDFHFIFLAGLPAHGSISERHQVIGYSVAEGGAVQFDAGLIVRAQMAPQSGVPIFVRAANGLAAYVCGQDIESSDAPIPQ